MLDFLYSIKKLNLMVCYTKIFTGVIKRLESRYFIFLTDADWQSLENEIATYLTSISNRDNQPEIDNHALITLLLKELKKNWSQKFRMFEDWLLQLIIQHRRSGSLSPAVINTPARKKKTKKKLMEKQIYS